jgi:Integrase zinc binding domain
MGTQATSKLDAREVPARVTTTKDTPCDKSDRVVTDSSLDTTGKMIDESHDREIPLDDTQYVAQSFANVVSLMNPHLGFPSCLVPLYSLDTFFVKITSDPTAYASFTMSNGLYFLEEQGTRCLCIPRGAIEEITVRETLISHMHSLIAHLSGWKMFHYLREHAWWPGMYKDIIDFCQSCHTCTTNKPSNQKLLGIWKDRRREFAKGRRERGIQEAQRSQEEYEEGKGAEGLGIGPASGWRGEELGNRV